MKSNWKGSLLDYVVLTSIILIESILILELGTWLGIWKTAW